MSLTAGAAGHSIEHMFDGEQVDGDRGDGEHGDREHEMGTLEAEMAEVAGVVNAAQGRLVALVADGLSAGLWQQGGVQSPAHWLTWQLGISGARARRLLALARRAEGLPATMEAFTGGKLSLDQAAVIARHVPAGHEASAARLARRCTVRQLSRALGKYAFDPPEGESPTPASADPERRHVAFGARDDGRWHLDAELPADEGAVVELALVSAHQRLFAETSGDGEAAHVTWADAFLSVAEASLTTSEARLPGAGRCMIYAHLEADPIDPASPGTLSLHLTGPLPSELRRLLECDASIRPVITCAGRPVNVGRSMRIVPDRTRRLVEHRDGGCAIPGCGSTRFLQIHHITHWEDGGDTDTSNLVALCRRHHRLHHMGALEVTGDADRPPSHPGALRFADERGSPVGPAATPRPPRALPAAAPYRHPTGERIQCHWLNL